MGRTYIPRSAAPAASFLFRRTSWGSSLVIAFPQCVFARVTQSMWHETRQAAKPERHRAVKDHSHCIQRSLQRAYEDVRQQHHEPMTVALKGATVMEPQAPSAGHAPRVADKVHEAHSNSRCPPAAA